MGKVAFVINTERGVQYVEFALRFAMKAAAVGLLVAVIVNLGSAQLPLRPAAQQRQAPAEWRSTKVSLRGQFPNSPVSQAV